MIESLERLRTLSHLGKRLLHYVAYARRTDQPCHVEFFAGELAPSHENLAQTARPRAAARHFTAVKHLYILALDLIVEIA
mmetsp:Transcript_4788/g.5848  ORF Transcript_4788/g.5848 Transcript_4788/m.5848 type:complete len:80 (-) Transcript_4788:1374-1613(-)